MYGAIILIHILSATIWTGGHLVLAITVLPKTLKERNYSYLLRFEAGYEKIGMPSLVVQILTGIWLAYRFVPDISQWFNFNNPVSQLISTKLFLLAVTIALAADARLRVIPRLSEKNLNSLAWHIISVTIVSILFVVVGVSFRTGWLFLI